MARKKKIEVTTDNDLGRFLTGNTDVKEPDKPKVNKRVKKRVRSDIMHCRDWLEDHGYEVEILPSGKTNVCHKDEFKVNGFKSTRIRGYWIHTLDCGVIDLPNRIKSLELV